MYIRINRTGSRRTSRVQKVSTGNECAKGYKQERRKEETKLGLYVERSKT